MELKFVLDCDESFKKKAAYTFETFFRILGLEGRLVEPGALLPQDILIWYGSTQSNLSAQVLFIEADRDAPHFFRDRKKFDPSRAKKFQFNGEESVALFYGDQFGRNPKEVISADGRTHHLHVDVVASAFYFLSCWHEIISEDRDRHDRFPASSSLQHTLGILRTPVVNQYVGILKVGIEKVLGHPLEETPRFGGKKFAVCITHDIDYIRKWTPGILYRELVQYFLLGGKNKRIGKRLERLRSFVKALSGSNDPYRSSLEKILDFEKETGVHATFFLKTGGSSKHDASYRIRTGYIRKLLQRCETEGHEVGIHPSYNAYLDLSRMREEKRRLDHASGRPSSSVRQHFLRFRVPETWRIQAELGLLYDTTLGYADHEGFRAGICHPFRPYDVSRDEVIDLWEIPLVAMDGTFQSYRGKSPEESLEIIKSLIGEIRKYRGVAVLLFHNTCYDDLDFQGWGRVFEKSIAFSLEEGGFVGSGREVLNSYIQSLNLPDDP